MYILAILLIILLIIAAYVIIMPFMFLRGISRWILSRFGLSRGWYDEMSRAREEMKAAQKREEAHNSTRPNATRNPDGKIFSANEGEYVEFEEIK